jgi:glucan 1,3-beta-glucosidase
VSASNHGYAVSQPLGFFALTALAIGLAWWWLGAPTALPPSPLASGEKLYCVSYAPFRDDQDPLVEGTKVPAAQIDEDMALLSRFTDCVRTYSVDDGAEDVLISARRYGLKVLDGVWVSNRPEKTQKQIATTVELAKKYPDVIRGIVVGNEVLLRGEMSVTDLEAIIREVKSQVTQPVTYADVWEFWLRYADLQNSVDFVTIHILPYWEDFPIPASHAAAHVEEIRKKIAAAIPNKEILIGETGWPSQGRMREGALPSPSNQARVIEDTLALSKRENFHVNVIEAFDQPWKRWLEGSAGRYWGIFDRAINRRGRGWRSSVSRFRR